MKRKITTQEIVDKQNEIFTNNLYEFEDWFELVDDDMKDLMVGFFGGDDPRDKIIERVIRKNKIQKINKNNERN